MCAKALEGDWEFKSEGCDPVKITVKNIMGPDWMVACMIPKGNMMVSMLKKVEGGFNLVQFNCSKKETKDNQELEAEFKAFLEKGISNIVKEGKVLKITAGAVQKEFSFDDILQKQEEEKQKKLAEAKLASGSGRFG
eukprot:TRINITY_DN5996_c0_g1_i1.p1 TRINITY_DN5996_c0_g1~~TRINITY_DN5996_c0_g1_i1.p1  ORF type:complete len:137 (-),score=55.61 TRINITY_DN5996_c0_g1_i1:91-501(-)